MNDTQLQCFLAAAKAGSFTEAAEKMYMTPPTFGRNISSLEEELGFSLFVRGWKNYRITPAGKLMYEDLLRLQKAYEDTLSRARALASGTKGALSLGLLEGQMVDDRLRNLLWEFGELYPDIQVEMDRYTFHGLLKSISEEELDVGITLTLDAESRSELRHLTLYSLRNELVLPKGHPLADRQDLTLGDFKDDVFLGVEAAESDIISRLMWESCISAGFTPRMILKKDLRSQLFALESGTGVAAFNEYHMSYNHPGFTHVSVPELPDVDFCAVWKEPFLNPAAARFVEFLKERTA